MQRYLNKLCVDSCRTAVKLLRVLQKTRQSLQILLKPHKMSVASTNIKIEHSLSNILDLQLRNQVIPYEFAIDTNNNKNTIVKMNKNYHWMSLFGKTKYGCMSMHNYNPLNIDSVKLKIFIKKSMHGHIYFGVTQSDFKMSKNTQFKGMHILCVCLQNK